MRFVHEPLPVRVVFGPGARADLPAELDRLGVRRPVLITTPGRAAPLPGPFAGRLATAVTHVPAPVAVEARDAVRALAADGLVAFGGGSAIGLAKAVALTSGLPIVAVPTTYAGSEMTPIWGLTSDGIKETGRSPAVLPRTVLYDPDLTATLPSAVAGPSGLNAIAHAVEALYAPDRTPVVGLLAEEAIAALGRSRFAGPDALRGAWLAGTCLGSTTMGLHHKLCHVLGGSFDLPHAATHAVILPHALAYNAAHAPDATAAVARALGGPAVRALSELARAAGAPPSLAALGLRAGDLDRAAGLATRNAYPNPRPITTDGVRALLQRAYDGAAPDQMEQAP